MTKVDECTPSSPKSKDLQKLCTNPMEIFDELQESSIIGKSYKDRGHLGLVLCM